MPNFVSPGVYVIEKDLSEYTPSLNSSVVGLVGFASKGPTNEATLITSQNQLISTFGAPHEDIYGQGLEGALEILEATNSLYFVRAADEATAVEASAAITLGTCPAVALSANSYGVNNGIYVQIQVRDNAGIEKFASPKEFNIPANTLDPLGTGVCQSRALKKVIGGDLDADVLGVVDDGTTSVLGTGGLLVGAFAGSGASISVSAYTDSTKTTGLAVVKGIYPVVGNSSFGASGSYVSSITIYGATFLSTGASSFSYLAQTLYPGAGYNAGTTVDGDTSGNSITVRGLGGGNFAIDVNENGAVSENFKASLFASGAFLEDVINIGSTNALSDYIQGNLYSSGTDIASVTALPMFVSQVTSLGGITAIRGTQNGRSEESMTEARLVKLVQGTYNFAGGNNGIPATEGTKATALIGSAATDPKTGLYALDDDLLNISIALIPGVYNQSVQNALITLAESSQNFIALVSPPFGVGTVQDAIDWSNGRSASVANSRTAAINSSYAAIYFPHVKVFSTFDGKDRWYDPTIFGARQMAFTDSVSETWFAPAGFVRGRLTKPTDVELKLNQGDRDTMYSGGNVLNPVVNFAQQGITIFGQRTSQRDPSALDRINVRRMMIYIRKVILASTRRLVFEPNDEFTWARVEGLLNPFFADIAARRGITQFKVVCDSTTNTPIRIDRNEMWCKVLIKPTKTAEIVVFELNLTNQSAQIG
jgi:phage tail sheath protein FI